MRYVAYSLAAENINKKISELKPGGEWEKDLVQKLQRSASSVLIRSRSETSEDVVTNLYTFNTELGLSLQINEMFNRNHKAVKTAAVIGSDLSGTTFQNSLVGELLERHYRVLVIPLRGRGENYYDPVSLIYKSALLGDPFVHQCTRDLLGIIGLFNRQDSVDQLEVYAMDHLGGLASLYLAFADKIQVEKILLCHYINAEGLLSKGRPLPGLDVMPGILDLNFYRDLAFFFNAEMPFLHIPIVEQTSTELYFGLNYSRRLYALNPGVKRMDFWDNRNDTQKMRDLFAAFEQ
jgi:hypothetical protein